MPFDPTLSSQTAAALTLPPALEAWRTRGAGLRKR
jgi:hypothetical protein